ncbi:beta-lactamase [Mariniradius saccharolyticus AK6]|uniref:Beta-lactamase n=1 Tax=Mariniradius saccharolyticus AK6 TaxID=1239962 RepID=M7Y0S9_9BACT|nr:serine hydrolase domain-containing protein [Mariniradius saccharolyticus]EMS34327.1 beta-lactamase [Mariniradius saccharolyticus AK6]
MKKSVLLFLAILFVQLVWAQSNKKLPPIHAGILDSLIGKKPGNDEPGFALGITIGNEIVLEHYQGLADLGNRTPISSNTLFNLASVSKHFTAFGILYLQERQKINLNAPVSSYLSGFPYSKQITPMQLLHHTSGIPSSDNLRVFAGRSLESEWGKMDELRLHRRYRSLNFSPGADFLYSNSGFFFLGQLIEVQSGLSYADFFERSLFPSMGIQGIVLDRLGKSVPGRAIPYHQIQEGFEQRYPEQTTITGESNIYLNLPSLMRWMQYLLHSNQVEGHFIHPMFGASYALPSGKAIDYSYGLEKREINSMQAFAHGGGVPGYASYVIYLPELELGISVLANSDNLPRSPGAIALAIAKYLTADFARHSEKEVQVEIELTSEVTQKYAGEYRFWDGVQFEIKWEEKGLFIYLPDAPPFQLVPKSEAEFFFREFDGQVVFTGKNGVQTLQFIQGKKSDPAEMLNPKRQKVQSPSKTQLLGIYEGRGLDVAYEVKERDGKPFLILPETLLKYAGFREVELIAIEGTTFRTRELGVIKWEVNSKGRATGFHIKDVGRLRNLYFRKRT